MTLSTIIFAASQAATRAAETHSFWYKLTHEWLFAGFIWGITILMLGILFIPIRDDIFGGGAKTGF